MVAGVVARAEPPHSQAACWGFAVPPLMTGSLTLWQKVRRSLGLSLKLSITYLLVLGPYVSMVVCR